MPAIQETSPVRDSVAKVNDELAVGSDLEFQARWEKFERLVWIVLIVFLLLSLAGLFGRGPLANRRVTATDGSMEVKYERVQRFGTPSVMTLDFPQASIQDNSVRLWASDALVKPLGAQRVVPQPMNSTVGGGGILYTFPATTNPASIEFQTQPASLGSSELMLQVPGKAPVKLSVFVVP